MSVKISHEALLPIALELYNSIKPNMVESISSSLLAERLGKKADEFSKFFHQLHDKLTKGEE